MTLRPRTRSGTFTSKCRRGTQFDQVSAAAFSVFVESHHSQVGYQFPLANPIRRRRHFLARSSLYRIRRASCLATCSCLPVRREAWAPTNPCQTGALAWAVGALWEHGPGQLQHLKASYCAKARAWRCIRKLLAEFTRSSCAPHSKTRRPERRTTSKLAMFLSLSRGRSSRSSTVLALASSLSSNLSSHTTQGRKETERRRFRGRRTTSPAFVSCVAAHFAEE